jgi:hypothetical protein
MQKYVLVLTSSAALLAGSALSVSAQQNDIPSMGEQLDQTEQASESEDEPGGMMRRNRMTGWHMMIHRGMMGGVGMRIIFALMDSDGDGTVSLQEFQAAHERIFKAMDTDKDGTLTLEEIQNFMHGGHKPAPQR